MAASLTASAQLNYSGSALSGLDYSSYYSGDAQYVAGTPDVAQLYTVDLSVDGDSPAVFVQILAPMTLDSLTASYSTSAGTTVAPYWLIYMTDDTGFTTPIVSTGSGAAKRLFLDLYRGFDSWINYFVGLGYHNRP